jgi:CHAT domain-containing protein
VSEAALLATLGGLELRTHRFLAADSLFARGLDLVHGRGAPEVEVRLRAGRADVLERRGNLAAAAEELRRAMALGEGVGVTLPFEDRSRLHAGRPDVYARLASILDRLGDPAEAFQVAERARAQRTLAALNGGRIEIPRGVDPALLEREQDLRMRLQDLALQMRGTGSLSRGLRESEGDPATGLSDLQALASELQGEYSNLLADLRRGAPDYLSRVEPPTRPAGDLVGLLEPHELILEYLMEDDGALVFVVTSEGISTVRMAVDESSLSDLVTFARGAIESQGGGDLAEFWRSPLRRLYRALIEPLETSGVLSGRESLIIVPHGSLHYLPFQALLDPSDDTFLIERYRVSYAPSASAWAQLRERTPPWPASGRRTDPRVLALAPKARELPGSAYEVETIGRLFGDRARVLRGESATEQAFVELAPGFDFVHLATFGRLNKINPLFSRVELSGGGSTPGFLEVHEIYGLQLKARLLTLSACETGLGSSGLWDLDPGDDWVSLASAFLGAGAANVMASLWRVEDTATATLMGEFYNQVADGWDLATSLAQAQQALIQDPTTAHPFFWAGFQLIGEGGRTP